MPPCGVCGASTLSGVDQVSLTLIGKPGCHLCDDARNVIEAVRSDLAARPGSQRVDTRLTELNILEDEQLARLHAENIPVVLIGEKRHAIWHVDREKFTTAVIKAAKRPRFSLRKQ